MGLDMTNYKMIYKDIIYNCLSIMYYWNDGKIYELEVVYLNENNRVEIIKDEVSKFQFINK